MANNSLSQLIPLPFTFSQQAFHTASAQELFFYYQQTAAVPPISALLHEYTLVRGSTGMFLSKPVLHTYQGSSANGLYPDINYITSVQFLQCSQDGEKKERAGRREQPNKTHKDEEKEKRRLYVERHHGCKQENLYTSLVQHAISCLQKKHCSP